MSQEAGYAIMGRIALFNQRWDEAITAYKNVVGKVQLLSRVTELIMLPIMLICLKSKMKRQQKYC